MQYRRMSCPYFKHSHDPHGSRTASACHRDFAATRQGSSLSRCPSHTSTGSMQTQTGKRDQSRLHSRAAALAEVQKPLSRSQSPRTMLRSAGYARGRRDCAPGYASVEDSQPCVDFPTSSEIEYSHGVVFPSPKKARLAIVFAVNLAPQPARGSREPTQLRSADVRLCSFSKSVGQPRLKRPSLLIFRNP